MHPIITSLNMFIKWRGELEIPCLLSTQSQHVLWHCERLSLGFRHFMCITIYGGWVMYRCGDNSWGGKGGGESEVRQFTFNHHLQGRGWLFGYLLWYQLIQDYVTTALGQFINQTVNTGNSINIFFLLQEVAVEIPSAVLEHEFDIF